MSVTTTVLIALVVLAIIIAKKTLVIIPQSETKIIERLGRYHATLSPGINIIIPFIDSAKSIVTLQRGRYMYSDSIDLREQVYDFDKQNVITKDNIDQTLTSRDTVNTKLRAVLDDATNKWGIKVNRVELQDITPPESVLSAMEKQMQAERNKRAAILTSEGEKQSQILQSEGDKAAMINRAEAQKQQAILEAEGVATARIRVAEAEAVAIKKITEAVGDCTNPANYLLAQKYIQMMEELAKGDKTKTVYLPYEATNVMGSLGGIKELFKGQ